MKKKVLLVLTALPVIWQSAFAYDFSAVAPSGQTLYYNIVNGEARVTSQIFNAPYYSSFPTGDLIIPSIVSYNGNNYPVTEIGSSAFSHCSGLTSVSFPSSITTIDGYAFSGCSALTSLYIPSSITSIGESSFNGCGSLTSIVVESGNPNYDSRQNCNAIIRSSTNRLIRGCKNTTIPNTVYSIAGRAFDYCSGLISVIIPNSVYSIENYTFDECHELVSVTIPNTVTSIGVGAFENCTSLILNIPSSVVSIGQNAFFNVRYIQYYGSASGSPWGAISSNGIVDGDFVFSNNVKDTLIAYIGNSGNVVIPSTVTTIKERAFRSSNSLTTITIPNSVTCISNYAFWGCSNLTSVSIPNSVTSIGSYTFCECSSLTSVTIGNSVTSIGSKAFYHCSGLIEITTLALIAPSLGPSAFYGTSNSIPVNIPCGSMTSYQSTWSFFSNFIEPPAPYSINVGTNNPSMGYSNITEEPTCDSIAVFVAVANYGYHFTHWNDGNTDNPRTIILNQDTVLTSYFSKIIYNIAAISNDTTMGNVSGSGNVEYLDTVELAATPNYGYHFTQWNDGNTDNPRNCVVTRDSSFTAHFDINQYEIIVNIDSTIHGTTSGAGVFNYLTTSTISATANYGYHFTHWGDGNTNNPRTITLTQDTSFTAYFEKNSYTITVLSNNNTMGQATGGDTMLYLDSVTISATSNYGYHFTHWQDNNTSNPRTVQVTQNKTYTAYFGYDQFTLTVQSDNTAQGNVSGGGNYNYLSNRTITATPTYGHHFTYWNDGLTENPRTITLTQDTSFTAHFAPNQYTLTVNAGEHGTAAGSGTYNFGDTITIQAFPDDHYHFTRWNDGNTENPRQYRIEDNITLTAFFVIDTYTVVVVSNDIVRGMVEASGTEFVYGTPCTVTATAYTGYTFAGWSNGVTANPYTFAVISDVELTALFVEEGEEVYTVTVESADPTMGTVSGGGQALNGGTVTITAIPNEGYRFLTWNDGNTENPRTVTVTGNITYTAYFESTIQGIGDIDVAEIKIFASDGRIVVQGVEGMETRVYDLMGREVAKATRNGDAPVLPTGVYLVKVGALPVRKVVVMR